MKFIYKLLLLFSTLCATVKTIKNKKSLNAMQIEITKGISNPTTFAIIATKEFENIINALKFNLEKCKRFIYTSDKSKAERIILIKQDTSGKIAIEVKDNSKQQSLKTFLINEINEKTELQACDEVYKILTHEKGIFRDKLILTIYTDKNTYELYSINSNLTNLKRLSSQKIKYLLDLFLCENKIFLSKYTKNEQAFSIMFFDHKSKTFYNVFSIKSAAVFAPVVYDREIYVAVSDNDSTGIFKRPFTGTKTYDSFKEFLNDPSVTTITNVKGKIATAPTVSQGKIAFCADFNGKPSIYLYPNKKISLDEGSYFDPIINDNYLAAIKTFQGEFHLVLINLRNGLEKKLLSKHYIGKPTWSPCGNWIAVSCRDKGCKDVVFLIHKTGKYIMTIQTNHEIKNIIWMKGR